MASRKATPPPASNISDAGGKSSGVARATGIMMAATLLSRLLGMLRDTVIAYKFGVSVETDAYIAAFKIPDLLYYLIAGGALSSTFVPVFSEYWHQNKPKAAWKTFSIVATATFIVATGFVLIAEIFTPQFVRLLNPGYSADRIALAVPLTRIVLPAQICFLLGGLLMGTQNARGLFRNPALAPSVYNLGIIFGALALAPLGFGISGLMWGALIGAFVGNFTMQLIPVIGLGMRFKPSLAVGYPGAVKVWKMMLPILLGVSLPNVDQIINTYFASQLPAGSQTAMTYANRVMLIPIGIFAQAMGIAILPTMAAMAANKQTKQFRATLNQGLRSILFLTLPASALLYLLAAPTIALLYQHGAFTPLDTEQTAVPLRLYTLGIFAWSAQAILTRGFYALQDSRTPVISGTILTVVFIGMNWMVVNLTDWGVGGLALATTVAATMHTIVMYVLLRRRLQGLLGLRLFVSAVRAGIATAALCLVLWLVKSLLDNWISLPYSIVESCALLGLAGGAGIAAYALVAHMFHMPEMQSVTDMGKRVFGRQMQSTINMGKRVFAQQMQRATNMGKRLFGRLRRG